MHRKGPSRRCSRPAARGTHDLASQPCAAGVERPEIVIARDAPSGAAGRKLAWRGRVVGVQPRIHLTRSYDQRSHLGYALRLQGEVAGILRGFSEDVGQHWARASTAGYNRWLKQGTTEKATPSRVKCSPPIEEP